MPVLLGLIGLITVAFIWVTRMRNAAEMTQELAGLPGQEEQSALLRSLQARTGRTLTSAEEALILGRWLVTGSGGPASAIDRIGRRLAKLDRTASPEPLSAVLNDVAVAGRSGAISAKQREAPVDLARHFKLG